MIIVSKDRTSLSNMEYVASIYIAGGLVSKGKHERKRQHD